MNPWGPMDLDASLLERARSTVPAEREAAFNQLFTAHRLRVLKVCLHITGNRADAEDAVQEVFLAVHRGLGSFRGDAKVSTWVYRIAIRAAVRVRALRPKVPEQLPLPTAPQLPDDAAQERQRDARLLRAVEHLSLEHRAVLSLFAAGGLGHRDIADVLGIPEGTVWSRLHLARKALAAALAG